MSPEAQTVLYLVALVAFIVAAAIDRLRGPLGWVAVGLAAWVFVAFYSAVRAL